MTRHRVAMILAGAWMVLILPALVPNTDWSNAWDIFISLLSWVIVGASIVAAVELIGWTWSRVFGRSASNGR